MKKFSIPAVILILILLSGCGEMGTADGAERSGSFISEERSGVPDEAPADTERYRHETDYADSDQADRPADVARVSGKGEKITREKAIQVALLDAGLEENDVTGLRVELDHDDGQTKYEVKFYKDGTKYEYDVDAFSGEVLKSKTEADRKSAPPSADRPRQERNPESGAGAYIGEEQAKEIALAHAGLDENSVARLRVKLERDDGRMEYEVEFDAGRTEYSYEIDAASGDIVDYEWDRD